MKQTLLLLLCTFFLGWHGVAQEKTPMYQQDRFELAADSLAQVYDKELVMRAEQYLLFRQELENNLKERARLESLHTGKELLDQLVYLRQMELGNMGNILTRIQFERYKKVRPMIQPLATVK